MKNNNTAAAAVPAHLRRHSWRRDIQKNWQLYIMSIPIILFFAIFNYAPMFGISMAFLDFKPARGFFGSEFVGFQNFIDFFTAPNFWELIRNTFVISALGLGVGFPLAILLALLLNEVKIKWFKKSVQTISYMPYFVSAIVLCGLIIDFCASNGIITNLLVKLGMIERQNLLQNANYFWTINLVSDLWQTLGYESIIFIAAITNVSAELHEAAAIDGASRLQRVWHITLPGMMPMIVSMFILRCGTLMSVGFDKILNLYNPSIYSTADVINTFIQRVGINGGQYGYATAVGLFNSVINLVLLLGANALSKKFAETSLF